MKKVFPATIGERRCGAPLVLTFARYRLGSPLVFLRRRLGAALALTLALLGGAIASAQTSAQAPATFSLVSAQVVTASGDKPPLLRLAANGPIAFRVLTADESHLPPGSTRLAVRLYGVRPGDLSASGALAPFSLVVTPAEDQPSGSATTGAIVNVGLATLPSGATLRVRAGQRTNEIEIVASN